MPNLRKSPKKKETQNVRSLRKRMPTNLVTHMKQKVSSLPLLCELRAQPRRKAKPAVSSFESQSKASLTSYSNHGTPKALSSRKTKSSSTKITPVHCKPLKKNHVPLTALKDLEKVWVYSEKDQVFLPCTVKIIPKKNSKSSLLLTPFKSKYNIPVNFSLPPKILPFDPTNLEEHQTLCYNYLSLPKFKKSKKLKEEVAAILNTSISNFVEEDDIDETSSLTSLDSDSFTDSTSLMNILGTSIDTKHPPNSPEPIKIIPLSQDMLTSDDEACSSPHDILTIGQGLLAYLSSEKKYAPAKLLEIRKTFFRVGFFNGTEKKLRRKDLKFPIDPDFAQVPVIELPSSKIDPNYSNDQLQCCVESIYPILDKIILGEYPSWRYEKFITSTASNVLYTLGCKRGGNPYSDNEYALIINLLTKRYGKNLASQTTSDHSLLSADDASITIDVSHEVKKTMRLIDLVLLPECMLRLLLVSHLLLNDHGPSTELNDSNTILSNSYHRLGYWEKKRYSSEKNNVYTLTLEQETPEIMEKAEYLLNNSNWAQAILTLRRSLA